MIARIVLNKRINGFGASFESAVVAGQENAFSGEKIVEKMVERAHGVKVTLMKGRSFTIPWATILYTNDTEDAAPAKGAKDEP